MSAWFLDSELSTCFAFQLFCMTLAINNWIGLVLTQHIMNACPEDLGNTVLTAEVTPDR